MCNETDELEYLQRALNEVHHKIVSNVRHENRSSPVQWWGNELNESMINMTTIIEGLKIAKTTEEEWLNENRK